MSNPVHAEAQAYFDKVKGSLGHAGPADQCDECNCLFFVSKDGPYVWVDRWVPAEDSGHSCESGCHDLTHFEEKP